MFQENIEKQFSWILIHCEINVKLVFYEILCGTEALSQYPKILTCILLLIRLIILIIMITCRKQQE